MISRISFLIPILFLASKLDAAYIYLPDKFIQEEISIGSLLVDISDEIHKYSLSHNTDQFASSQENQQYTFLDDHKSSKENTYFLLDSVTGRVTSKRYLDRESMCMNKHCLNTCELSNSFAYILSATSNTNPVKPKMSTGNQKGHCVQHTKKVNSTQKI